MNINCKICLTNFENDVVFHKHLRTHKITQAEYYQTNFKRVDRYDGSIIKFKNKDYYFNTEFNSKNNLKKWIISFSKEAGINYCRRFLLRRKEMKSLIYSPSQFELRTLCYPSIKFFHKFYGKDSYENICKEIGLINRYDYNQ